MVHYFPLPSLASAKEGSQETQLIFRRTDGLEWFMVLVLVQGLTHLSPQAQIQR